jgi:DNA-binding PadR family transcriptional regulator
VLDVNYGTIYPALRRLERQGWVRAWWGLSDHNRRARFYELTAQGRRQLDAERTQWQRFAGALALILKAE